MIRLKTLVQLLALLSFVTLKAQITVEVRFDQQQYLPHEPVIMEVRITNFSGQTLRLGEDPGWLDIWIETAQGIPVRELKPPPVVYPFEVPNAARGIRRLNLTPYYEIHAPGQYKVFVAVYVKELGYRIKGEPGKFTVVHASPMWEQTFGYLQPGESSGYEIRRYALIQKPYGRRTLLYVQVSNADGSVVYGLIPVGQLLTFSRPETQLDRQSRLHLLWQVDAKRFWYVVVDPDGNLKLRQTYRYTYTRPRLRPDEQGGVKVIGGMREIAATDIPPPPATTSTNSPTASPSPGSTNTLKSTTDSH